MHYRVCTSAELSPSEIEAILGLWNLDVWKDLSPSAFRKKFERSEFHLLTTSAHEVACVARLYFDFRVRIGGNRYPFAEFVGFVAKEKRTGNGTLLLRKLIQNLKDRNLECIGFCNRDVRDFYQKNGVNILRNKAGYLAELVNGQWIASDDDDILDLTLSKESATLLSGLGEGNLGYLEFDSCNNE